MTQLPPTPDIQSSPADANALLTLYLNERSEPCPGCGYDLRNLTSLRCPECGQELRLRVGLVTQKLAAFITGLVALAASVGFSGLILVYAAITIVLREYPPPPRFIHNLLISGVVSGLLMGLWVKRSKQITRQPAGLRWFLALLCYIVPLLNVTIFTWLVN